MKSNLIIISAIWIFLVLGCGGVGPRINSTPKAPQTPSPTATPAPPIDPKVYREGYKVGYRGGSNPEGIDVDFDGQVYQLASASAIFYKPQDEDSWDEGWVDGFVTAYNKRRPKSPILDVNKKVSKRKKRY